MDITAAQRVDLERRVAGSLRPTVSVLAETLAALVADLPHPAPAVPRQRSTDDAPRLAAGLGRAVWASGRAAATP